ncbi:hypothetical protein [Marinibacterium sp. SX1]|uniref:hypothetical protein n=1 Tax=Marinibacterium sp. SX1 TaxID=3388424 RepID=UPI003D168712
MKLAAKNMISRMANGPAWPLFRMARGMERRLDSLCTYAERQRRAEARSDLKTAILADTFPDLRVTAGPFAGMRYPDAAATGSALLPKLAGSYESELAEFIEIARSRDYGLILDIGCAEGFYAVGLARLFPDARVLAYDVDAGARAMCRRMAEANDVADRVDIQGFCDTARLKELAGAPRALLFADCEGFEAELFTAETAPALAGHDIIIECHDFKDPTITPGIVAAFSASHDVTFARARSELAKAQDPDLPAIRGYNAETRRFIVSEARNPGQFWLFLSSKSAAAADAAPVVAAVGAQG